MCLNMRLKKSKNSLRYFKCVNRCYQKPHWCLKMPSAQYAMLSKKVRILFDIIDISSILRYPYSQMQFLSRVSINLMSVKLCFYCKAVISTVKKTDGTVVYVNEVPPPSPTSSLSQISRDTQTSANETD